MSSENQHVVSWRYPCLRKLFFKNIRKKAFTTFQDRLKNFFRVKKTWKQLHIMMISNAQTVLPLSSSYCRWLDDWNLTIACRWGEQTRHFIREIGYVITAHLLRSCEWRTRPVTDQNSSQISFDMMNLRHWTIGPRVLKLTWSGPIEPLFS